MRQQHDASALMSVAAAMAFETGPNTQLSCAHLLLGYQDQLATTSGLYWICIATGTMLNHCQCSLVLVCGKCKAGFSNDQMHGAWLHAAINMQLEHKFGLLHF